MQFENALLSLYRSTTLLRRISSGSTVIPVLGAIAKELQVDPSTVQWVLSAYATTFAAFMLLAGRLADIYPARFVFCCGFL